MTERRTTLSPFHGSSDQQPDYHEDFKQIKTKEITIIEDHEERPHSSHIQDDKGVKSLKSKTLPKIVLSKNA